MDAGYPQRMTTPYSPLNFNDFDGGGVAGAGSGYLIQFVDGVHYANVRTPNDDRPHRPGGLVYRFYKGPKLIAVQGLIVSDIPYDRVLLDDYLRGATESILAADGRYYWTTPDMVEHFHTVRLHDAVVISIGGDLAAPKQFAFTLIAANPEEGT